jgi:hypothetical protein
VFSTDPGFCAFPCQPQQAERDNFAACQHVSQVGVLCQDVGILNLGFDPGPVLLDPNNGALAQVGGFCFHQCERSVQASCDAFQGTVCGTVDENVLQTAWNGVSMCLPDGIRR